MSRNLMEEKFEFDVKQLINYHEKSECHEDKLLCVNEKCQYYYDETNLINYNLFFPNTNRF